MANLKYRAWDKELQIMLDVSLIDFKKRVFVGEHWRFGETNFMSFDEIELMQSTGRKDTDKNEIFAGDILKVTDKNEGRDSWFEVVSYNEEKAMFVTDEVNKNSNVPAAPLYSLFDTDLFIVEANKFMYVIEPTYEELAKILTQKGVGERHDMNK